ncbi:MAG TPA: site-2 protease family protein [Chloroflexota bacterium]|nr:site-2 protease family protein [Chloroflexota bacterium]
MLSIDPRATIALLIGFVIAIAVHEFCHAAAARALGDTTAQRAGRLTLNPLAHLDPMGTLMLVMTSLAGVGFGWGKPVPVDGRALRLGRLGMALVSAAGPLSNFVLALGLFAVLPSLASATGVSRQDLFDLVMLNLGLCAFNLLPIAPLDGFGVLLGVLPRSLAVQLARLGQYGPVLLLILVFSGSILRFPVLGFVLRPVVSFLLDLILRVTGAT